MNVTRLYEHLLHEALLFASIILIGLLIAAPLWR
jgi:hypothetical protein